MEPTIRKALILDFDGTMTIRDVGDEVCDRFAPPAWREIDLRWARREISLPEAQRQMWGLARGTQAEMEAYAREIAVPRPGLRALMEAARARGFRIVVASGGFDFYLRPVLADLPPLDAVHANGAIWNGDRMTPVFNAEDLECPSCAVCKGRVCDRERALGAEHVVFAGDGLSDRCAIGKADAIAAVRGGAFETECRARGVPCTSFDDFAELLPVLSPPLRGR